MYVIKGSPVLVLVHSYSRYKLMFVISDLYFEKRSDKIALLLINAASLSKLLLLF